MWINNNNNIKYKKKISKKNALFKRKKSHKQSLS